MRSSVAIGKKIDKNQKWAAMCPFEKTLTKINYAQQCGDWKKNVKN